MLDVPIFSRPVKVVSAAESGVSVKVSCRPGVNPPHQRIGYTGAVSCRILIDKDDWGARLLVAKADVSSV